MMSSLARRTGRLLIVDDDEGVTQTFAGILRLEGHQVRTAANAYEGLREVESFRPDAIILDLRMPLINGLGFLYRLRGFVDTCRVPVAMITGDCTIDEEATSELRDLGAQLWLKPLWTEDLISIADKLLGDKTH
ncbi:MAG TPA: response regulator [Vicinamibacterales bacterium]|jgi:DNA-binding response OmpR family regulator|nr:response regulator [Vicinamibacterales bacterium]